jgi:hypothetical protein
MKEVDRLSYSFGMKINLGNYESADFHISYSTDVREGEGQHEALARAIKFVEEEADKKYEQVKGN